MKHVQESENVVQDLTVAHQLATLLMTPGVSDKAMVARRLAYEVLGFDSRGRHYDPPLTSINEALRLIPWNEPVFLLRAQDPLAVEAVNAWLKAAEHIGIDHRLTDLVRKHVKLMSAWPTKELPVFMTDKTTTNVK